MKDVEQNSRGDKYCAAYYDDGVFKLRTFGRARRTEAEIADNELNINEQIGFNNYTIPISGFSDPYITATFITNHVIFINLFHNHELMHYHFFFDSRTR